MKSSNYKNFDTSKPRLSPTFTHSTRSPDTLPQTRQCPSASSISWESSSAAQGLCGFQPSIRWRRFWSHREWRRGRFLLGSPWTIPPRTRGWERAGIRPRYKTSEPSSSPILPRLPLVSRLGRSFPTGCCATDGALRVCRRVRWASWRVSNGKASMRTWGDSIPVQEIIFRVNTVTEGGVVIFLQFVRYNHKGDEGERGFFLVLFD